MESVKKLSTLALIGITISAIVNLRSLPIMASAGGWGLALACLAAVVFLLPSTYVCTRFTMQYNSNGGVYRWVMLAFGQQAGFVAIWLEWINNIVAFPAMLSIIIAMLLLLLQQTSSSQLLFSLLMLGLLWGTLCYNLLPLRFSSWLSTLGTLGTLLVALLILTLGVTWLIQSPAQLQPLSFAWPHDHILAQFAVFVSFIGAYSGMQITGFHRTDVRDAKQFKQALPLAALLIAVIIIGSSTLLALLIPQQQLGLMTGIMQLMQQFSQHFHLAYLGRIAEALVFIAILASLSAWLIGPARGIQAAISEAGVSNFTVRLNRYGMPKGILLIQGLITSVLVTCFYLLPSVKTAFWFMIAITSQFTALMYVLVFAAALKLVAKTFWGQCLCWLGIGSCLLGFGVGVLLPGNLHLVNYQQYTLLMIGGDIAIIIFGVVFSQILLRKVRQNNVVPNFKEL